MKTTQTGRRSGRERTSGSGHISLPCRLGFGLKQSCLHILGTPKRSTLFSFKLGKNGDYTPSTGTRGNFRPRSSNFQSARSNVDRVAEWARCRDKFMRLLNTPQSPVIHGDEVDPHESRTFSHQPQTFGILRQQWHEWADTVLRDSRMQRCPCSYRDIARSLNRIHDACPARRPRTKEFTELQCRHRWRVICPRYADATKTAALLKKLKHDWKGFDYVIHETVGGTTAQEGLPVIRSLHILWPWSKSLLKVLAPSLFCDATFNLTIYTYKCVAITTLDGNKHHRPLMHSFIPTSTADDWKENPDLFFAKS